MRLFLNLIFFIYSIFLFSQSDTIVVADLTEIMVEVKGSRLTAVTDLENVEKAGFFIEESLVGSIRICNDEKTFFWINGSLLDVFSGCNVYDLEDLNSDFQSDTLFVSLYSKEGIQHLTCENVIFQSQQVVKTLSGDIRHERDLFNEFLIVGIVTIILCYGWTLNTNPNRRNYLLRKSFSLKLSSYEFVNTTFLNQSNFQFLALLSIIAGLLFCAGSVLNNLEAGSHTLLSLVMRWLSISGITFLLLLFKWLLASVVSALFRLKKMNDYQLFDFENFMLICFSCVSTFFFIIFFFPK